MKQGEDLLKMLAGMYSRGLRKEHVTPQHALDRERVYKVRDVSRMMPSYGVGGLKK